MTKLDKSNGMEIEQKRELLKKLKEKQVIEKDSALYNFQPNPIQKAFLLSPVKVRILAGANRSGKTEVSAVDTLIQCTTIVPKDLHDLYPQKYLRPGRYWVSSTRYPVSRDVAKPKIDKYIPRRVTARFNKSAFTTCLKDGSQIGFKSMDAGRDAYAGDSRLQIWMDEEHNEDVYHEAYMRTIDCKGRLVMSFTPVDGLTWAYEKLYRKAKRYYSTINKHGIKEEAGIIHTPEEMILLRDREIVMKENTNLDADPNIEVFQMAIYDNPYLPDEEIQNAEKDSCADIALYQARMLGHFTKITGRQYFSIPMVIEGKASCSGKFRRGEIEGGKFIEQKDGRLVLFKKKEFGVPYIVGADIALGLESGDYSCAQIINHRTCEQVGVWHGKVNPEMFARILVDIGRYFNYAILAPERNFHGYAVVAQIRDQKYRALYCDDDDSLYVDPKSERHKFGWLTDARTKPQMTQDMGRFLSQKRIKIHDADTWEELLTYVYDKNGKLGALKGCYDDKVMALMIAVQVFIRKRPRIRTIKSNTSTNHQEDNFTGY